MQIAIDASRYAHNKKTGVEHYGKMIIDGILEEAADDKSCEILLYSKEPLDIKQTKHLKNKVLKSKRLWTVFRLSLSMLFKKPEILFVPSHVLPFFAPKKSVITIHDVAFKQLRLAYSFFQYHYLNFTTRYAVKKAAKIIVPSESTKLDLIKYFNCPEEKIVIIHHGFSTPKVRRLKDPFVDMQIFKYFGINKETPYFLFIGRLETKKNLERLIKAFAKVIDVHSEYKLVLAGEKGVGFDKIYNTVKELNLEGKVIMPGYVTVDEKHALLEYCQAFAFISLYEGFGFPGLEAFYFKKPVLASSTTALMEIYGDGAYFVDPLDVQSIEMGLLKLISDKAFVENLVEVGKEKLKDYSWKSCSKETFALLKNL